MAKSHSRGESKSTRNPTDKGLYSVEPRQWVKLRNFDDPAARLDPGSFATAVLMRWNLTNGDYEEVATTALNHGEFRIYDAFSLNFVLPGEVVPVRMSQQSRRYEIDGSHGLRRKAIIDLESGYGYQQATEIEPGECGRVLLYTKGAETNPKQYLTACLDWLHGDVPGVNGTRVIIQYYRDEPIWTIEGIDCEPTP